MSWNYRVIRRQHDTTLPGEPTEDLYSIMEVYYDGETGKPNGFCDASVDNWSSLDELRGTLQQMLQALDRPVISE